MNVLSVASEIYPLVKTGGLADVAGALPLALRQHGIRTRTLVPGYPAVMTAVKGLKPCLRFDDLLGHPATVLEGDHDGLDLLVLDAPALFDRLAPRAILTRPFTDQPRWLRIGLPADPAACDRLEAALRHG